MVVVRIRGEYPVKVGWLLIIWLKGAAAFLLDIALIYIFSPQVLIHV